MPGLGGALLGSPFLERTGVPIHQNVLIGSKTEARRTPRGDLELAHCRSCDFVTNQAFDPTLLIYGDHYARGPDRLSSGRVRSLLPRETRKTVVGSALSAGTTDPISGRSTPTWSCAVMSSSMCPIPWDCSAISAWR